MMARLVPYPALTASLFGIWLLLAQSVSPGQILLAAAVATGTARIFALLRPGASTVVNWRKAIKLGWLVLGDILRSNLAVAWIVISNPRARTSSFIQFNLDLRDEVGLTLFALIVTATPGTAWVQFDRASGSLLIHVFDLVDEEQWITLLKTRYEALLMEIFEG